MGGKCVKRFGSYAISFWSMFYILKLIRRQKEEEVKRTSFESRHKIRRWHIKIRFFCLSFKRSNGRHFSLRFQMLPSFHIVEGGFPNVNDLPALIELPICRQSHPFLLLHSSINHHFLLGVLKTLRNFTDDIFNKPIVWISFIPSKGSLTASKIDNPLLGLILLE